MAPRPGYKTILRSRSGIFPADILYQTPRAPDENGPIFRIALTHHQEECADLYLAVRMAVIADEVLGQLTQDNVW